MNFKEVVSKLKEYKKAIPKITTTQITVCVICFIVSLCFTIQVRTINTSESDALRLKKENELRDEILQWKEVYEASTKKIEDLNAKIEEYRSASTKVDDTIKIMKKELDEASILAGLSKLKGPGITVTLDDTEVIDEINQTSGLYNPNVFVIHDTDIISVINELAAAGAEAFSVNGQRIIATSSIRCVGPVIQVNGINLSAPYTISAIGSPTTLRGALSLRGGIVSEMRSAKIDVEIKEEEEIVIPEYTGILKYEYATSVSEVE